MDPFLLLLPLLLLALTLLGWGPGHHLEFATRVHRRRRECLPKGAATLIGEERDAFFYGNLAADIINLKAYGGHRNHCHRWTIIDEMRAQADSPAEEAFILGYLAHLAADTIAHNHFVPYHLVRYARGRGLGHLYWEMMADRHIAEQRWELIPRLKEQPRLAELDELINAAVPRKALSMGTNKLIFDHVLLVSERGAWRRGMERLHPIHKVKLEKGFLARFQKAAVARVREAMSEKGRARLAHIDTTGKAAQREAARLRREVVHRYRAGRERDALAAELAQRFLQGMESPPANHRQSTPIWTDSPEPARRGTRSRPGSSQGKRK